MCTLLVSLPSSNQCICLVTFIMQIQGRVKCLQNQFLLSQGTVVKWLKSVQKPRMKCPILFMLLYGKARNCQLQCTQLGRVQLSVLPRKVIQTCWCWQGGLYPSGTGHAGMSANFHKTPSHTLVQNKILQRNLKLLQGKPIQSLKKTNKMYLLVKSKYQMQNTQSQIDEILFIITEIQIQK